MCSFWGSKLDYLGSGCGSVGRAVASDTRGPRFEYSHRQKFIYWTFIYCGLFWKDENKEKIMAHFLKKLDYFLLWHLITLRKSSRKIDIIWQIAQRKTNSLDEAWRKKENFDLINQETKIAIVAWYKTITPVQ